MEDRFFLPEGFFIIQFFDPQDYFKKIFESQIYNIIGKDDVGNFIGISLDGQVFYLNTASQGDKSGLIYISKNRNTFIKQIELYHQYSESLFQEDPSEDELKEYENKFRELILEIDPDAFCNDEAFWSTIAEEMGYGIM